MKYINFDLNPSLLFTTDDKNHSFYEDVLPSERIETSDAMFVPWDYYFLEDNIDKDDKPLKITLTKNKKKK